MFNSRTELLLGQDNIRKLSFSSVAVFGIGGVGGYVVEALARAGVGTIALFDNDIICPSNINRQIIATTKNIGTSKVVAAEERLKDINPNINVAKFKVFYSPETAPNIRLDCYDYIVDAIDTVTCKLELITNAKLKNIPIISCMGTGNKLNPAAFEVSDINKTSVCPLAKIMRKELKNRNIINLKVVYSKEQPLTPLIPDETPQDGRRQTPGSVSFVPSAAGLVIAAEVIKDLINLKG